MGMGYVGRNSETELSRWAGLKELVGCTSATVDCYFVEWLVLVVSARSSSYGRVQDSELRRSVFFLQI